MSDILVVLVCNICDMIGGFCERRAGFEMWVFLSRQVLKVSVLFC